MRKFRFVSLFCLTLTFGLFRMHAGDMFVVKDKCYVPLFENNKEIRSFERGANGCNCYDLDTALLPGSVIEVIRDEKNDMAKVKCEMTEKVKHEGFVYKSSIEDFCKKFGKGAQKRKRSPMSLDEIRSVFKRIRGYVPYCWGSNQFEKIPLPNNVNFKSANGNIKSYELRGFDCSGLLYYISDGTLPHATGALENFGKRLFTVEASKKWEVSKEDLECVVSDLRDTDFIAIKGHVIISYNGGFIEFRSKDLGCQITETKDAVRRVKELIEAAKDKGSDVWFVRWHPECL